MASSRLIVEIGRQFGRRHIELAKSWVPSAAFYGLTTFVGIIYFTDWKVIADKIPIYNMKFKNN